MRDIVVDVDEARMAQVVWNLLSNALKFTPVGGTVRIKAEQISDRQQSLRRGNSREIGIGDENFGTAPVFLRLRVIDSGAGISPENLPKLFKHVVQFNAGKLQKGGGSGFGLFSECITVHDSTHTSTSIYIITNTLAVDAKAIVDLHGGRISVHSEGEGEGCTFTLDIPVATRGIPGLKSVHPSSDGDEYSSIMAPAHRNSYRVTTSMSLRSTGKVFPLNSNRLESNDEKEDEEAAAADSGVKHFVRVLVVDDATTNRKMLCRLLQEEYETFEAEDGQEAVEMVLANMNSDSNFQVVLMDNHMPRMDGPTACKLLREKGYTGVIIGVTGNALQEDLENYLSHGAARVFPKPVDVELLHKTIAGRIPPSLAYHCVNSCPYA